MNKHERTYLTPRFFMIFAGLQLLGMISIFAESLWVFYLGGHGVLLLFLVLDHRTLVKSDVFEVTANIAQTPELDHHYDLVIDVKTRAGRALHAAHKTIKIPSVSVFEDLPPLPLNVVTKDDVSMLSATASVRMMALGFAKISDAKIYLSSLWGIFKRQHHVSLRRPLEFRVIPTKRYISEQEFHDIAKHQRIFYQGTRNMLQGGLPEQFHSMRPYRFPDPVRFLDAKKTARLQKPMTRIYDSLYQHHLIMAMDVGRSTLGYLGESRKFDFYLAACLELAKNAQKSQDRVSYFAFSQNVHHQIKAAKSFAAFEPLIDERAVMGSREQESEYDIMVPTIQRLSGQRAVLLIFTDASRPTVQQNLLRVLPTFCRQHLTVVVSLLDAKFSLDHMIQKTIPSTLSPEAYNEYLYAYWVNKELLTFQNKVNHLGGGTLFLSERDWLSCVVKLYEILRRSVRI